MRASVLSNFGIVPVLKNAEEYFFFKKIISHVHEEIEMLLTTISKCRCSISFYSLH